MHILNFYDRKDGLQIDRGEKIGNLCLHFLRTACGKSYEVTTDFKLKAPANRATRISHLFYAIITFPLIIAGSVAVQFSKTYAAKPLLKSPNSQVSPPASPSNSKKTSPPSSPDSLHSPEKPKEDKPEISSDEVLVIETLDKLFEYYARDNEAKKILRIKNLDLSKQDIFNYAIDLPNLTSIELENCKLPNNIHSLVKLKKLESLKISNCGMQEYHVAHIAELVKSLSSIDFSHNNVGDFTAGLIITRKKGLKLLNLDSTGLASVKSLLDKHYNTAANIDYLSIKDNKFSLAEVIKSNLGEFGTIRLTSSIVSQELEDRIIQLKNPTQWKREHKTVVAEKTTHTSAQLIDEAIANSSTTLHLNSGAFSDEDCEKICQMKSIELLVLDETPISISQLEMLVQNGLFKKLHLIGIQIGTEEMSKLTLSRKAMRFTEIKFERCGITDELFEMMKNSFLVGLKSLIITDNLLTEKSINSGLKKGLTHLDLSRNCISRYGIRECYLRASDKIQSINLAGNEADMDYFKSMNIDLYELNKRIKL